MKGLKKIALATAIAAAPFASHAGMKALDDTTMGNVTGQAGVTIELETQVSIGKFTYTDEGSFNVNNIVLGGAGVAGATHNGLGAPVTNLLDDLKIDIDVEADGDAFIHVGSISGDPIDWGMTAGSMELVAADGSESTTLISNLSGHGNLAQLDIRVDTATDELQLDVLFNVADMNFDVEFLGVGIRNMAIMGGTFFEQSGDPITDNFAYADVHVYKGDGLAGSPEVDVLRIDVNDITMDMFIGAIEIGGTSIGSVALDNLTISNTTLAVYGH